MEKKLYISLPISGRNLDDVKRRAEHLKASIEPGAEYFVGVTPFDICPDSTLPYSELMGRDIAGLLECDAVLFDYDWYESKGCRTEMAVAEIYGKRVFKIKDDRIVEDTDKIRYSIELNKKQLAAISEACDAHCRNICGQLNIGLEDVIERAIERELKDEDFDTRMRVRDEVKDLLNQIKLKVWKMPYGASYGVKYDEKADILFDVHQILRHQLYLLRKEKLTCTVDSTPGSPFSHEPMITCKRITDNGK